MVVIYGRRRIEKTTLISEFIENKKSIFFSAEEANDVFNFIWRNNINFITEIRKLMDKKKLFPQYNEYYFYFFSKEKFSDEAKSMEKENNNLKLID